MTLKPDVTVAAIVMRDDRFLLVEERAARRVVLNQPAGHLETGETLIEAVVREALEETAWTFRPQALTGIYLWKNPANGRSFLRIAFAGIVEGFNAQRPLDRGILRTLWFTREELLANQTRHRSPLVMRCVDDFIGGRRFPLDMIDGRPLADLGINAFDV
ncbi:MAG TPA: NUDIX hydrolase [Steroidobacteraceae bacterium]|nr:NUDIX hydrolase [Steroidobacteraceae bacterium]